MGTDWKGAFATSFDINIARYMVMQQQLGYIKQANVTFEMLYFLHLWHWYINLFCSSIPLGLPSATLAFLIWCQSDLSNRIYKNSFPKNNLDWFISHTHTIYI